MLRVAVGMVDGDLRMWVRGGTGGCQVQSARGRLVTQASSQSAATDLLAFCEARY